MQVANSLGLEFLPVFQALETGGFVEARVALDVLEKVDHPPPSPPSHSPLSTTLVSGLEQEDERPKAKAKKKRKAQVKYSSLMPAVQQEGFYDWVLETYSRLTPARLDEILDLAEAAFVVKQRPRTMQGLKNWIIHFVANQLGQAAEKAPPAPPPGKFGGPSPAEAEQFLFDMEDRDG